MSILTRQKSRLKRLHYWTPKQQVCKADEHLQRAISNLERVKDKALAIYLIEYALCGKNRKPLFSSIQSTAQAITRLRKIKKPATIKWIADYLVTLK